MLDVSRWLAEQGLGHHAEVFAKNGIAGDILRDLTDTDLKELGLNLGDRKRLLNAIAALDAGPTQDRVVPPESIATAAVPREAERRQLTVMFVDLVGSTALSQRLDPEEMGQVLRDYQNTVAGEIARFEGHIAKFMGDGVLCYFGWPTAHEGAAERAVHTGLAIVAAVDRLPMATAERLAARVGIATGLVVVGDLVGTDEARERTVIGETPNLAARLQGVAAPGQVVVADGTRRLVGGLFEVQDLGEQSLKGFGEPVRVHRVIRPGVAEGRFEALHGASLAPMVGREQEIAVLTDRWRRAEAGEGQVVLLSGEPGIGKSRLALAMRERLRTEPRARLRYYGSPYHTNSALWPVIDQLERAAGLTRDEPAATKLAKLEALLDQAEADVAAVAPVFAELLAIPTEGRYPPVELTPQQRKARTFAALLAYLEDLAGRQGPALMVLEDAHWIDPTTLELFELVKERIQRLPALLVVTCRPEFEPAWTGHSRVTTLTLNRLGHGQAAAIIEQTAGKALPSEVASAIVTRTDGVPLFVEELTKAVLESGLLSDAGDRFELSGPLPPLAIPATLHDSLMARLDRLAPVKEVAQIGAVIGREFSYELLVAVADRPEDRLRAALDQLVQSELIFRRGTPPEATYSFKHALVQDVAYQSLLKSRRRQLHGRIARVLEQRFSEAADAQPELLARHYTEAGLSEKAVDYWYQAGRLASERSALTEAIGHFGKALELVVTLPDSSERVEREIDLQIALGGALISAKGHAAPETGRAYARAHELCWQVGDPGRLFPLLFGRWVFHMVRAEHAAARDIAEELLRSAEGEGDVAGLVVGHRSAGIGALWRGELVEARGHLERTIALYDPARHRSLGSVYAYDPRLAGMAGLAFVLFVLGYPEQAVARCREAVDDAGRSSHPAGLAYALYHACMFDQIRRDLPCARQRAAALIALATEHGFAQWQAAGVALDGWALVEHGRAKEGIARIERGIEAWRATGAAIFLPYFLALLGWAHGVAGRAAEGLRLLSEAVDAANRSGEHWFEAESHRLKGELLRLAGSDQGTTEACFLRAMAIAREQSAKLWELRATTSLARLWAEQGRRAESHDLLAPVYGWFTEGSDTADLEDAKALLEESA
jgi:predicted ATPase/class 3 adenylate cyclase